MTQGVYQAIFKAQPKRRITIGVVYPALKKDGHKQYMTPDEIEKSAHQFLAKYRRIGLFHAAGTTGHGTVVESWIHRGPDWIVKAIDGRTYTVKAGDWCVAIQWDAPAWALVEKGLVDGFSYQGRARTRPRDRSHAVAA
ncbi:MAG: XkdF-like putative serine protease domain-containing protein [Solirubrobacteraceae bacterium]